MRNKRNSKRNKIKLLAFILTVASIAVILNKSQSANHAINQRTNNSLKNVVGSALIGAKGTYGIVVKNLKTGEAYSINAHKVYEPGSLYKIWVMATAFVKIQNGILKADELLSEDVNVLSDKFNISSKTAEMTEGIITLTVNQALEQMITISHNYATLLLMERIKRSSINSFLAKNGFNESSLGEPPHSTPYDIALFFEKLYKGELVDQEHTNRMLNLLKKQKLNDKLPKHLPKDTVVAHKTGEINFFSHDAGIVFLDEGDYMIVVLSETNSWVSANERIAKISKAVYDYFTNKNKSVFEKRHSERIRQLTDLVGMTNFCLFYL